MNWKEMFSSMNDKNMRTEDQEVKTDMPQTEDRLTEQTQEIHQSNVEMETAINQMADAIQKELYEGVESKIKELLSPIDEKLNSLYQTIELLGNSQQQILKNQVDMAKEDLTEKEKIAVIAEKQEETIQKQHNSSLKFQEDVIYKIQKNLIMELIGISDNIRMMIQNKENDADYDLLEEVRKLGEWVDASLSNNSVRKYQDADIDNTVFNRKRQELVDKEETSDENKHKTYKTIAPGYVWTLPYLVVNSDVQLKKILEENGSPQMFSYVIRPEEIVELVYKNKTEE